MLGILGPKPEIAAPTGGSSLESCFTRDFAARRFFQIPKFLVGLQSRNRGLRLGQLPAKIAWQHRPQAGVLAQMAISASTSFLSVAFSERNAVTSPLVACDEGFNLSLQRFIFLLELRCAGRLVGKLPFGITQFTFRILQLAGACQRLHPFLFLREAHLQQIILFLNGQTNLLLGSESVHPDQWRAGRA